MTPALPDARPRPAPDRLPPLPAERRILERYASDGAFLWRLRGLAVKSWAYDAARVGAVDERLEAHVDGLRVAGADAGPVLRRAMLDEPEPGHVFLGAVLATEAFDLRQIASLLDLSAGEPPLARAFASGLAWVRWAHTSRILPGLLAKRAPPELLHMGIAASALHRRDPGPALRDAMYSEDVRLRARAFKAAGELGLTAWRRDLASGYTSHHPDVRLWSGWAGALLGDPAATAVLQASAATPGRRGELAAQTAARKMDVTAAGDWIRSLFDEAPRAALLAAGALGDPQLVPWLLGQMRLAPWARLAAFAMSMITGIGVEAEGLTGRKPPEYTPGPSDDPDDPDVQMDPDDGLPWPDLDAVRAWWSWRQLKFRAGARLLLGKPIEPAWLGEVLRRGAQPLRAAAAVESVLLPRAPSGPLPGWQGRSRGEGA